MPKNRDMDRMNRYTVTEGSRRMIPAYPMFLAGLGLTWLLTPPDKLHHTPVYDFVIDHVSNYVVGSFMMLVSLLLIGFAVREDRSMYVRALIVFEWIIGIWAIVSIGAYFFNNATFGAWMWPAMIAWAARTSRKSLEIKEVQPFEEPVFEKPDYS